MITTTRALLVLALALPCSVLAQGGEETGARKRARLKDAAADFWIYDDIDKGYATAKATGKPLLMDRFVCVRLVQMHGVDLERFAFDGSLTWAVFMMNADGTIYGRYGSRSGLGDRSEREISVTVMQLTDRFPRPEHTVEVTIR